MFDVKNLIQKTQLPANFTKIIDKLTGYKLNAQYNSLKNTIIIERPDKLSDDQFSELKKVVNTIKQIIGKNDLSLLESELKKINDSLKDSSMLNKLIKEKNHKIKKGKGKK